MVRMIIAAAIALSALTAEGITLDDAVRTALTNHPSAQSADAAVAAAREGVGVARAATYPLASFRAEYKRFETHAFLPSGIQVPSPVIGPIDNWGIGADVAYTLYDHGARKADIAAARAGVTSTTARAGATREEIAFHVHDAYFRLAAAEAAVRAARSRLDRSEAHVKLAVTRREAGAVPPVDVIRARTEAARARLALVDAATAADIARGALNAAMGLSPDAPVEIGESALRSEPLPDVTAAMEIAVDRRPDVREAHGREALQSAQIDSARSNGGPKARLQGGYGRRDSSFFPEDPDWFVGGNIAVPLFDGYATKHRVARARAELRREQSATEALLLSIRQEVWSAWSTLRSRREAVDAAEASRREAAEAVRLANARYDAGAGTINDLLDAEAALLQAEAEAIQAAYQAQIAWSGFEKSTGALAPEMQERNTK